MITTPAFTIGDRVIAPGTAGAFDRTLRDGGPGEIVGLRNSGTTPMAYVTLDGSAEPSLLFALSELKHAPAEYPLDQLKPEPTI